MLALKQYAIITACNSNITGHNSEHKMDNVMGKCHIISSG